MAKLSSRRMFKYFWQTFAFSTCATVFLTTSAIAAPAGDLNALLANANAGETIKTKPRDFGDTSLNGYFFEPPVTIKLHKKASLSKLTIRNSVGLHFEDSTIEAGVSSNPGSDKAVFVFGGGDISFRNTSLSWSSDGDALNDGTAMVFDGVAGLTVQSGTISNSLIGIVVRSSSQALIQNVTFTNILADGVVASGTNGLTISDNTCTGWVSVVGINAHPDCIQLQSGSRAVANTNSVITNNMILKGAGAKFQGIFIASRHDGVPHINTTVENNIIKQDIGLGIAAANVQGLTIRNNDVLPAFEAIESPRILVNEPASAVLIEENIASAITAPPDATVRNNTILD